MRFTWPQARGLRPVASDWWPLKYRVRDVTSDLLRQPVAFDSCPATGDLRQWTSAYCPPTGGLVQLTCGFRPPYGGFSQATLCWWSPSDGLQWMSSERWPRTAGLGWASLVAPGDSQWQKGWSAVVSRPWSSDRGDVGPRSRGRRTGSWWTGGSAGNPVDGSIRVQRPPLDRSCGTTGTRFRWRLIGIPWSGRGCGSRGTRIGCLYPNAGKSKHTDVNAKKVKAPVYHVEHREGAHFYPFTPSAGNVRIPRSWIWDHCIAGLAVYYTSLRQHQIPLSGDRDTYG